MEGFYYSINRCLKRYRDNEIVTTRKLLFSININNNHLLLTAINSYNFSHKRFASSLRSSIEFANEIAS